MMTDANVMPGGVSFRLTDPRALLLAVMLVVTASMATVGTTTGMLVLFLFVLAWHAATAMSPAATVRALRRILLFAALIIVINALLVPGDPLATVAGRRFGSVQGLHDGVFFALRLGVMLMAVSLLLAGSHAEAMARGVHDLLRHVSRPLADRVAFVTFLSMGFVPLFADEIRRVRVAQTFRGGNMDRGIGRRAGSVRMWLVPVLMSAVRRSGQLALAVELRDVRARLIPSMPRPRMRAADVVWFVAVVALVWAASWNR